MDMNKQDAAKMAMPSPEEREKQESIVKVQKLLAESEEHICRYFQFGHLPLQLQEVSAVFAWAAVAVLNLPRSPERTVALRKLLEGKDAAVRAAL